MPRITNTRLAEVKKILDDSFFTSAGFDVETSDDNSHIVSIRLRDNNKYSFLLRLVRKPISGGLALSFAVQGEATPEVLQCIVSPGDFRETEYVEVDSFQHFLKQLKLWTIRLKKEILLVDILQKQFEDFQDELNRRLEEHISDDSTHFSKEERESLYEKLRLFEERLTELEADNASTKKEYEEIIQVIGDLAQAAHTMSKRSWFRTACSKLYLLSTRALTSKAGQKLIEGAIDRLLENGKS
jgi:hypothetical protein